MNPRRFRPLPRAGPDLNRPDLNRPDLNRPDLKRMAPEKIMEPEFHRIERPPPYVFAEAVARACEGPAAHEGLYAAGRGRKLAW